MLNLPQFVKRHATASAVVLGLIVVAALLWNSTGSHKYLHGVAASVAVFGGVLIGCTRLWGKLWFWFFVFGCAIAHVVLWWVILNLLLSETQYLFLPLQVGVAVAEIYAMTIAICALEQRRRSHLAIR